MSPEQQRQLNFLASCPAGHTTMTTQDVHEVMMATGGNMLARGSLYDIVAKPLGAGVFKVSLKLTHP